MQYKTYIIEYTAKSKNGGVIKSGKVRAKRKMSSFEAQAGFENHLIKKHKDFGRLVVHKCYEEPPKFDFDNFFNQFFG